MKGIIAVTATVLAALASGLICRAQSLSDIEQEINIEETVREFSDNLSGIEKAITLANTRNDLNKISKDLAAQDLRFDTYYSLHMNEAAEYASVLAAVAKYNESRSAIDEALTAKTALIDARNTIAETEMYLCKADSTYSRYLKTAKKLSLAKQSAKLLDKLKAKEQVEFAKIQAKYDAASAVAESVPEMEENIAAIEEKFTNISVNSGLIQKMEYKSPVQRAKDWLMSLAAVAILLMFVNMIQARISAFKKEKENLKKMREALGKNDDDIPTI